ncbi:hypothetical protein TNCV_1402771 [Trichonephila clavipes]|nr:hypothetical protein TNCV_1402771 [Trichonephila clavipes]
MRAHAVTDVTHTVIDEKTHCLEIYRTGQIIPAFEILRKIFLLTCLKKGTPGNVYENALPSNIQNGTDHCRLRNPQKNISPHFPEEEDTRFRIGTSRFVVECSTTELYHRIS